MGVSRGGMRWKGEGEGKAGTDGQVDLNVDISSQHLCIFKYITFSILLYILSPFLPSPTPIPPSPAHPQSKHQVLVTPSCRVTTWLRHTT